MLVVVENIDVFPLVAGAGPRGGQPRPGLCHGAGVAAGAEAGAGAAAGRAAADQAGPHDRARGAHEGAQGELGLVNIRAVKGTSRKLGIGTQKS